MLYAFYWVIPRPTFRNIYLYGKSFGSKIFEPNFSPHKYPNILNPSHSSYLPAYEDGIECSESLFSSQTFSIINTPTFSTPVILHTYPPMKMEQTECSETLA